jgi:hypothetical protein
MLVERDDRGGAAHETRRAGDAEGRSEAKYGCAIVMDETPLRMLVVMLGAWSTTSPVENTPDFGALCLARNVLAEADPRD